MIELRELTKFYGSTRAVSDLSCTIPQGEIAGILGLNGAGKSTLLRMLAGDLLPTAGTIQIDEIDAVSDPLRIRARIGFLPEEPPLYEEMTVAGYLSYLGRLRGLDARRLKARLDEVMARTGIEDHARRLIGTLSTGYRKRLGIAQAIVHEPLLVILDEPISGLDPVQIAQMREMIKSLRGEHTVLVSSHILPEIHETCDEILVLREGELVFQGTEAELNRRVRPSGTYEIMLRGEGAKASATLSKLPVVEKAEEVRRLDGLSLLRLSLKEDAKEDAIEGVVAEAVKAGFGVRRLDRAVDELEAAFLAVTGIEEGTK